MEKLGQVSLRRGQGLRCYLALQESVVLPGTAVRRGHRGRAVLMWAPWQTVLAAGGKVYRPLICISDLLVPGKSAAEKLGKLICIQHRAIDNDGGFHLLSCLDFMCHLFNPKDKRSM